jgi:hypothetical protein
MGLGSNMSGNLYYPDLSESCSLDGVSPFTGVLHPTLFQTQASLQTCTTSTCAGKSSGGSSCREQEEGPQEA